jgi:VanZ family protein
MQGLNRIDRLVPTGLKLLAFWGCVLAVAVLSLTPVAHLPPQVFDVWDKAQHAFGFAVLTLLGWWAYPARVRAVLAGLLVYGVAIELAQGASGWRHGDVLDWLADAFGVAVGAILGWAARRYAKTW